MDVYNIPKTANPAPMTPAATGTPVGTPTPELVALVAAEEALLLTLLSLLLAAEEAELATLLSEL